MKYINEYENNSSKLFIFGMRRDGIDHAEWVFSSVSETNRYGKIYQLDIIPNIDYEKYVKVELWEIEYTYDEKRNNTICSFAANEDFYQ